MRIVTFGEGMIEIAGAIGAGGRIAYGGDVLNVTIALARLGFAPALLTALGTDAWSDELVALWVAEGIDTSAVARHPERVPGLYGIRVDADGERTFTYWRDRSAARDLFALPQAETLLAQAAEADLFFLSGITLSLYDAAGRARIAAVADAVKARGGIVAFDGNYRPRGWADHAAARAAFAAFAPHATLALPTAGDEAMLHGHDEDAPEAIATRWHQAGVGEVVVKLGAEGAHVSVAPNTSPRHPGLVPGSTVPRTARAAPPVAPWIPEQVRDDENGWATLVPTSPVTPIDTSGAGDAFDAGYLAARLAGQAPVEAARFGHRLAGETILHPGAIPPRDAVAHLVP